ncbi:ABC transporter ATP-binding protein [Feifania hominis]|uniref:ABC transporter ATP-binding protein n=1 Tax=Feifania hominis TaxID=2763660 RepID=A0A926DC33_9FIRM|nr:ABC transporter ATP-binding protein [Feifania hominis]MBC8535348.1 ABC transporter ATP-binding protein [Feifania hominis]
MNSFETIEGKRNFDLRVWAKLGRFFRAYSRQIAGCMSVMLVVSVIDIILPLFQRYAINHFIEGQTTRGIWPFTAVYFLTVLSQALLVVLFTRLAMRVEMCFGRDLKNEAFQKLQEQSFSFYNVTPVGYLVARVMSDTNKIGSMVAWGLVDLMWSAVYVIGVVIAMVILNWKLALLVIAVVPPIALTTVWFQRRMLRQNRKVRHINSRITGEFNEGIGGAVTTKTLVLQDTSAAQFRETTGEMKRESLRFARYNSIYMPIIIFFGAVSTALILARGGRLVMDGAIPFGTLSVFITYSIGIFEPIEMLARIFSDFVATQVNIERVSALLEREPDIQDTPEVVERYGDVFHPKRENFEPVRGEIEFCDVSFHYSDAEENILEHFNLKVEAGQTVAIVGDTGAGKSTLVNLVCRFFEPTRGEIRIDGKNYKERSVGWLHGNIGYVLQSPHLFSGTIRENIRYGKLDATDAEIEAAAKLVSLDTVVARLEQGYDTDVGEGGDRLSTGEKQLVSFARAVLADPPIFVLDEATSSIDTRTEALIQNAISRVLKGRTSFLIAHRLSTVRYADVILVVNGGKIIERGTHEELLGRRGYYYNLYVHQFEQESASTLFRGERTLDDTAEYGV